MVCSPDAVSPKQTEACVDSTVFELVFSTLVVKSYVEVIPRVTKW